MVVKMIYDVLASFTCPRTITFKDWRLGFTHKALMVAIISYVCWNLFSSQSVSYTHLTLPTSDLV